MDDHVEAQNKLVAFLRDDPQAIPYVVGYLTHGVSIDNIKRAMDSYWEYNEKTEMLLTAARKAKADSEAQHP